MAKLLWFCIAIICFCSLCDGENTMSQNAQKSGHQPSLMMILINDVLEDLHEAKNEIRAVRHENKELRDEIQEQQIYIDEQNKADEAQVNAVVQRNSRVTACSPNCAKLPANYNGHVCNEHTLKCSYGCIGNFEGDTCDRCKRGKAGPRCDTNCDYNCQNCTWDNGVVGCDICRPGYYYFNKQCEQCRLTCLQNSSSDQSSCDKIDGTCSFGCIDGWNGDHCNTQCGPFCVNRTCNRQDACCTQGCRYNTYGGCNCQTPCNPNCGGGTCYQNETCSQGCKPNTWGPACSYACSINCKHSTNNATSPCNREGQCLFGCKTNFTGPQCSDHCPDNCLHGNCDPVSGACLDGCAAGHSGRFCNETACGDSDVVKTHDSGNSSSLLEIIFNRLDPNVKSIKIVFN